MTHESSAERGLKELCRSLGLQYAPQDWGIVNADGQRLSELIAYYEANPGLSATQKFELGELILASANERLANARGSLPRDLRPFLLRNRTAFETKLEYWRSLRNNPEFPLANGLEVSS